MRIEGGMVKNIDLDVEIFEEYVVEFWRLRVINSLSKKNICL